ncbi:putative RNA methyltransferase [Streptomyces sp. NPDC001851]|uniref:putative RNA methyltransferase n=1 Tax=Streptomyces sp. NPDC001851 TaxID=3154529 RepID=UPI00332180C2
MPDAPRALLELGLRCPHCSGEVTIVGNILRCAEEHSRDMAKQGCVNLLRGAARFCADTAEMVAARSDFLAAGHYAPIAESLAAPARETAPAPASGNAGCVVDVGGGGPQRVRAAQPGRTAPDLRPDRGPVICGSWWTSSGAWHQADGQLEQRIARNDQRAAPDISGTAHDLRLRKVGTTGFEPATP